MSSSDFTNTLKELLARSNMGVPSDAQYTNGKSNGSDEKSSSINPSQAIIIAAMLAGVLEVTSVLVDRNQTVEIVLTGSLKKKTELEKLLDQVGSKPFDEVVKAMLGRL